MIRTLTTCFRLFRQSNWMKEEAVQRKTAKVPVWVDKTRGQRRMPVTNILQNILQATIYWNFNLATPTSGVTFCCSFSSCFSTSNRLWNSSSNSFFKYSMTRKNWSSWLFRESQKLTEEQIAWASGTTEKIYSLLRDTPPDGIAFAETIQHILKVYWFCLHRNKWT